MYNYQSIKKAFYLIESPMQLMSAIEAKHYFAPDKNILFIRYNGEARNDLQIKKLLKYDHFDRIYSTTIKKGHMIAYSKLLYVYLLLLIYRTNVLFVGNFKENFMKCVYKLLKKQKCIFLDDGAQSSYLYSMDRNANMFSYFKFAHDGNSSRLYVHNSFEFFRSQMQIEGKQVLDNTVFFIGAPLVEKNMIDEEQFHFYFSKIAKTYNDLGQIIKYIPHRHEETDKLQRYSNIVIDRLDEPIELYLLHSTELPSTIASFYSAALYSIQIIFHEYISDITSYYLPPANLSVNQDIQSKISAVYKTLEQVIKVNRTYINN